MMQRLMRNALQVGEWEEKPVSAKNALKASKKKNNSRSYKVVAYDAAKQGSEEKDLLQPRGAGNDLYDTPTDSQEVQQLFIKRSWAVAITPLKNHGPTLVMSYMMGTSGMFALVFLLYTLLTTTQTLLNTVKVFSDLKANSRSANDDPLILQRIVYAALSSVIIAYFIYRALSMGIISVDPTAHLPALAANPPHRPARVLAPF